MNLRAFLAVAGVFGVTAVSSKGPEEAVGWQQIEISVGEMVFDALEAGPEEGELVLLLHGFPQTGYSYRHQIIALAKAGYRAVAPDQRGYSPGARPTEVDAYRMQHLVGDVLEIADALGSERFHLIGHDWGGAVAWVTATRRPDRVITLTVLSTPHFQALASSFSDPDSDQSKRSSYFGDFAAEGAEKRFLADDKALFRQILAGAGGDSDIEVYLDRLGTPDAMRAALNWYTALVASRTASSPPTSPSKTPSSGPPPIGVPTLYIWGTEDSAFGRAPAEATADFVDAPYRFVELEGRGHWLPEEAAERVNQLVLEHLAHAAEATP